MLSRTAVAALRALPRRAAAPQQQPKVGPAQITDEAVKRILNFDRSQLVPHTDPCFEFHGYPLPGSSFPMNATKIYAPRSLKYSIFGVLVAGLTIPFFGVWWQQRKL